MGDGCPGGASAGCVSTRRGQHALPGALLSPMLGPVPDGGRYEVRCIHEERVCLLLLSAGDSLTAAKLTGEQALHLGTLLASAASRLVSGPGWCSGAGGGEAPR